MTGNKKIAITVGDAGGIGPEICIKAFNSPGIVAKPEEFIIIGNRNLLNTTALDLGLKFPSEVEIFDIPFDMSKLTMGKSSVESGKHSFQALKKACEMAKKEKIRAIVTAPTSKEAINSAGYHFTGQTEILEEYLKSGNSFESQEYLYSNNINFKKTIYIKNKLKNLLPKTIKKRSKKLRPEMLFVADSLRVLLLTRHLKLDSVSSSLNTKEIIKSILVLNSSLIKDFKIENPRIAMCALNPHAGENGLFGHEEDYIIKPALKKLQNKYGINVEGPFPADTLWAKTATSYIKDNIVPYDAYAVCYHDQGLIPIKMLAMDKAVNTTINLPIIRTSPCHGTAYDIAGQNKANCQSMIEAINLAYLLSIDCKDNQIFPADEVITKTAQGT